MNKLTSVLLNYFKKHWQISLISFVIIILDIILSLLPPILLKYFIDGPLTEAFNPSTIIAWSFIYLGVYLSYQLFEFLKNFMLVKISQGICKEIRLNLLTKYNSLSYFDLEKLNTGEIESYFNNDVNTIETLVADGVINMCIDLLKIIGTLISIFVFSFYSGLVVLCIVPFLIVFVIVVKKQMYKSQLKMKKLESKVNQQVLENIENIQTIQTYNTYEYLEKDYQETLVAHFNSAQISKFYDSIFSPIMVFLRYALIASIIMIGSSNLAIFNLTSGMIVSFTDLISSLFTPIENVGMELQTLQQSHASINRLNNFMNLPSEHYSYQSIKKGEMKLEFIDVSFSYNKKKNVISHFNYTLKNNMKLTLEGPSGVGKSTLFKLAYGLIRPDEGRVLINGLDTYLLNEESRQETFGIIYQDAFFSNQSLKSELTLNQEKKYSDQEVNKVLKEIGLGRINDLNKKFDARDFSSGELSLLNLARVLIIKPKVIFLDEMNAKIDTVSALNIIDLIQKDLPNSMVLSISHFGKHFDNSEVLILKQN